MKPAITRIYDYCMTWQSSLLIFLITCLLIILPSVTMESLINPTQTGKFIFFSYSMILVSIVALVSLLTRGSLIIRIGLFDLTLLLLVTYILINRYLLHTLQGFSIKFYELIGLSILYVVIRKMGSQNFKWLFLAVILSGIIQCVYGQLQLLGYCSSYHSGFRMTGSFFNPGPYAGFLAGVFPIVLGVYLFRNQIPIAVIIGRHFRLFSILSSDELNSILHRILFEYIPLLGMFLLAMVLPASQSRAAWLSAGIGSAVLLVRRYQLLSITFGKINEWWQRFLILILMVGCLCGGTVALYHFKQASADGRILIWKALWSIFKDDIWTGVGFDRYKAYLWNRPNTLKTVWLPGKIFMPLMNCCNLP